MGIRHSLLISLFLATTVLADEGPAVQPDLSLVLDHSRVASGGLEQGSRTRALLEAGFTWDLERSAGLPGAVFFAGVQMQRGGNGSDLAGDIQSFSNIDADDFQQFGEVGFSQTLKDGRVRYRIGRLDANSEFSVVEAGGEFINSSAGYTPPIHTFPSYPNPVWAANLSVQPVGWFSAALGLYDSLLEKCPCKDTASTFAIFESRFSWNEKGRLVLGLWRDHGKLPGFDGALRHSHNGYYGILEQPAGPKLDLFLQAGSADEAVAEITSHYAAGLATTGLLPSRPDDTAGFMTTRAGLGGLNGHTEYETALELYYGFQVGDRFVVKPDLQYIIHPSGDPAVEDALVLTLRVEFGL